MYEHALIGISQSIYNSWWKRERTFHVESAALGERTRRSCHTATQKSHPASSRFVSSRLAADMTGALSLVQLSWVEQTRVGVGKSHIEARQTDMRRLGKLIEERCKTVQLNAPIGRPVLSLRRK